MDDDHESVVASASFRILGGGVAGRCRTHVETLVSMFLSFFHGTQSCCQKGLGVPKATS